MRDKNNLFFKGENMSISSKLAEYAIKAFQQEIPEPVVKMAIQAIIDQYGLQIGGSEFPWSKAIYKTEKVYNKSSGSSTITRYGDELSPTQAAFINSSFAHAQDFDDSHQEAQTHPGSVVIPAAIAIGEELNLPGVVVLKAIIIGMEVMLRLAHSLCPACIEGGHHTPPTVGPFGAAIACGLLLGLNKTQLTNALGICGSYAGGLVEYTISGGSVKRIHTGLGARAGLEAALLAKEGLTGPLTIIEGKKGLWEVFGRGKAYPERLFDQIGERFMLATLMFKPFNCCYLIHPAIQVFLEICKNNSLSAKDIESVTVGYSKFSISHAGKIMVPEDELGAQFSTSFTLALSLINASPGMWAYTKEALSDERIINLAKRISVYEDEEANHEFPKKNGCIVNVTTSQGKKYSLRIKDPKGSPLNLLSTEDVKDKFMRNTIPIIGREGAESFYQVLTLFEEVTNVKELNSNYAKQTAPKIMAKL